MWNFVLQVLKGGKCRAFDPRNSAQCSHKPTGGEFLTAYDRDAGHRVHPCLHGPTVHPPGGHFLCWAVRDARLYMGYFWEIFCTFSARWVPFFNKISVFFLQGGYLFWRKILYLSNKMEPIYKKFCEFYSTKLLHFTHKISVYFYMMSIFSRDLLYSRGATVQNFGTCVPACYKNSTTGLE